MTAPHASHGTFTLVERRVRIKAPLGLSDAQVEREIDHAIALFEELLNAAARTTIQQIDLPGLTYAIQR